MYYSDFTDSKMTPKDVNNLLIVIPNKVWAQVYLNAKLFLFSLYYIVNGEHFLQVVF